MCIANVHCHSPVCIDGAPTWPHKYYRKEHLAGVKNHHLKSVSTAQRFFAPRDFVLQTQFLGENQQQKRPTRGDLQQPTINTCANSLRRLQGLLARRAACSCEMALNRGICCIDPVNFCPVQKPLGQYTAPRKPPQFGINTTEQVLLKTQSVALSH
jgi:hypothetical protein